MSQVEDDPQDARAEYGLQDIDHQVCDGQHEGCLTTLDILSCLVQSHDAEYQKYQCCQCRYEVDNGNQHQNHTGNAADLRNEHLFQTGLCLL